MTPVGHSEVMPVEIGSNVSQTLKTFIADINSFPLLFLDTLHRGIAFACGATAVPVDIWEGISTVLYPYLVSPPVIASIYAGPNYP